MSSADGALQKACACRVVVSAERRRRDKSRSRRAGPSEGGWKNLASGSGRRLNRAEVPKAGAAYRALPLGV